MTHNNRTTSSHSKPALRQQRNGDDTTTKPAKRSGKAGKALSQGFVAAAVGVSNKENTPVGTGATRPQRTAGAAQHRDTHEQSDNDDDDDEDYEDHGSPDAPMDDGLEPEEEEEEHRGRRPRRAVQPSAKKQQLIDDEEEAEQRRQDRAAKEAKAAARRAGEPVSDDEPEPYQDTVFETRDVNTRLSSIKASAQRSAARPHRQSRHPEEDDAPLGKVVFSDPPRPSSPVREERRISFDRNGKAVVVRPRFTISTHMPERWQQPPPEAFRTTTPSTQRQRRSSSPIQSAHRRRSPSPDSSTRRQHSRSESPRRQRSLSLEQRRSQSPRSGDKRSLSRSSSVEDDEVRYQPQACRGRNRPTLAGLSANERLVVTFAINVLRCTISADEAFVDAVLERKMVKDAFKLALDEYEMHGIVSLTQEIYRILAGRFPHTRGEMKAKGRPIAENGYGFKDGHSKKVIARNRKLAEDLKEDLGFAYKDPVARTRLYQAAPLQKLANAMYFANRRDEGPMHPEVFNPFPLRALALILTVLENCIDEWATGTHTEIPFTSKEYRDIYEGHVAALEKFKLEGARFQILEKILTRMHNIGRAHSGAQPLTDANAKPRLSSTMMEAALHEFESAGGLGSDDEDDE